MAVGRQVPPHDNRAAKIMLPSAAGPGARHTLPSDGTREPIYRRRGSGHLIACRTDKESVRTEVPVENDDDSLTCSGLAHWLETITRCDTVSTDRAHV